jgi:hypothetical protein
MLAEGRHNNRFENRLQPRESGPSSIFTLTGSTYAGGGSGSGLASLHLWKITADLGEGAGAPDICNMRPHPLLGGASGFLGQRWNKPSRLPLLHMHSRRKND